LDLDAGRVPGLPNLHSHAFQRAMAGLTERRGSEADSFWTWREQMYRFVERLTPDDLEAIAAQAYMEMLEAGFTWVAEFHYLHHQPDGRPVRQRRRDVGAHRGGGRCRPASASPPARALSPERISGSRRRRPAPLRVRPRSLCAADGNPCSRRQHRHRPHSLRAVTLDDLQWASLTWAGLPAHIHVAEQTREVDDCIAAHGRPPIDLLLDTVEVDARRWCLVHATHANADERARIARTKAIVGLCPITEANLGDGLFDVPRLPRPGGRFGVGSDSNVRISAPTSCAPSNTASA
jgi:cytosine/adenosine deaminase-related metal-dependent hydrolase